MRHATIKTINGERPRLRNDGTPFQTPFQPPHYRRGRWEKQSILTIHAKATSVLFSNIKRMIAGRYCWVAAVRNKMAKQKEVPADVSA